VYVVDLGVVFRGKIELSQLRESFEVI